MAALRRARVAPRPIGARTGLIAGVIAGLLATGAAATPIAAQAPAPRDVVVLLHGMGRTPRSMQPLEKLLVVEGFDVLNFGYSSQCCTIPELAAQLRAAVAAKATDPTTRVHFVGHSLGNIIVRWMLAHDTLPLRVGRIVMLAPPNQGSHAADRYASMVGWFLKPIRELRTDSAATVNTIPALTGVEIGVISGRGDGKVSIGESHLPEETDHVIVKGSHSWLMNDADVQRLTLRFLRTGRFAPE